MSRSQGKQLRFHVHPDDLTALGDGIRSVGAMAVSARSSEAVPTVHELAHLQPGTTTLLTTRDTAVHLQPRSVGDKAVWVLNAVTDPVVELSTSPFDGRILRHGRLYYVEKMSTGQALEWKPEEFLVFAGALFDWLRGWCIRGQGRLLGPAAAAALEAGEIVAEQ